MGVLHWGLLSLLAASPASYEFEGVKASATQARPLGFFNDNGKFVPAVGGFTLGATDHVTDDGMTYGDDARFDAHVTVGADEYRVELLKAGFPPVQAVGQSSLRAAGKLPQAPGHPIGGGVLLDRDVFGTSGIGAKALTGAHAAVAVFGIGRVYKDGKLLTDRARIQVTALTRGIFTDSDGVRMLDEPVGRPEVMIIADNLPKGGFLQFGFDHVEIAVNGQPVTGAEQGTAAASTGEATTGTGGAGAAGQEAAPGTSNAAGAPVTNGAMGPAGTGAGTTGTGYGAGGSAAAGTGGTGTAGTTTAGTTTLPGGFIGAMVVGAPVSLGGSPLVPSAGTVTVSRDLSESLTGRPPITQRAASPASVGTTSAMGNANLGTNSNLTPAANTPPPVPNTTVTLGTGVFATPTLNTPGLAVQQAGVPAVGTPGAPTAGTPGAPTAGTPGAPISSFNQQTTGGAAVGGVPAAAADNLPGTPRSISSITTVPGREGLAPTAFSSIGIPATPQPLNAQPATPLPFTATPLNAAAPTALPSTPSPANTTTTTAGTATGAPTTSGVQTTTITGMTNSVPGAVPTGTGVPPAVTMTPAPAPAAPTPVPGANGKLPVPPR